MSKKSTVYLAVLRAALVLVAVAGFALGQVPAGPAQTASPAESDDPAHARQHKAALLADLVAAGSDPQVNDKINQALADEDWYIRGEAALTIARFKRKVPADWLGPLLKDKSWFVRAAVLDALGVLGEAAWSVCPEVQRMLDPSDPYLCARAAAFLSEVKYSPASDNLIQLLPTDDDLVKQAAALALGELKAGRAVDPLVALLKDPNPEVRAAVATALGQIGDKRSAQPVETAFKDSGDEAWQYGIALYRLGNHDHLDSVTPALESTQPDERMRALTALGEFADTRTLEPLIRLARHVDPPPSGTTGANRADNDIAFRVKLAAVLSRFDDERAAAALVAMMSDPAPQVRAAAVEAVSTLASTQGKRTGRATGSVEPVNTPINAIISLLKHEESPEVLAAISKSIGSFDRERAIDALLDSVKSGDKVRQMLADLDVTEASMASKLESGSLPERMRAAAILGRLGDHQAVVPLSKALVSPDSSELRAKAAQSLGEIGDRAAEEPLLEASRTKDPSVRAAALTALGHMGDISVTTALFDAARDQEPLVRDAAVKSLSLLGISVDRLAADAANPNWQTRVTAISTLARLSDPRAVPIVISAFKDSDAKVRIEAARALAVMNDPRAVDPLIGALKDQTPDVRAESAAALGVYKAGRALGPLTALLSDRDARVSDAAAESLARMQDPRAIGILVDSLASPDWHLRARAAQVMMRVPGAGSSQAAVTRLVNALRDPDLVVRYYAAEALVGVGEPAVPQLTGIFKSGRYVERERAARILARIGRPSVEPMSEVVQDKATSPELRAAAARVLGFIADPRAIDPLLGLLSDQRYFVREQASTALGRIGAPALDKLVEMAGSKTPATREAAVAALGAACIGIIHGLTPGADQDSDPAGVDLAVKTIVDALGDSNAGVRSAAVIALGETLSKQAVPPLMSIIRDESSTLRGEAAVSLGKLGKWAVPSLIAALADSRPSVRMLSAQALGDIRPIDAVPALIQAVSNVNSGDRAEAIDALGKIGDVRAVEPIIQAMQGGSTNIRRRAVQALALLPDPRVEPVLLAALADQDEGVRQTAAIGLGEIGDERAVKPLEQLADNDASSDVRSAAVAAIERLQTRRDTKK
ncbi:MAG TPA: HEAT repeat domain-containing protein [Blastocatellia bacterium]|nr:HEAT repeat domain-containing protein [Blastocatellia bacterium]